MKQQRRCMTEAQRSGISGHHSETDDWLIGPIIWIVFVGIIAFVGWLTREK